MVDVILRRFGVGMEFGTVVEWRVASGDSVTAAQVIAVVETDKVDIEIEAPEQGVIEIRAQEGEEVPVGGALATIRSGGDREDG